MVLPGKNLSDAHDHTDIFYFLLSVLNIAGANVAKWVTLCFHTNFMSDSNFIAATNNFLHSICLLFSGKFKVEANEEIVFGPLT